MSDAVVPHKAEAHAPGVRFSSKSWLGRAVESDLFYSFRRSKITMVAAAVTLLFFLLAILASVLSVQNPFDPAQLQLMNSRISPLWTADGQSPFLLGTDEQGRHVSSAILWALPSSSVFPPPWSCCATYCRTRRVRSSSSPPSISRSPSSPRQRCPSSARACPRRCRPSAR